MPGLGTQKRPVFTPTTLRADLCANQARLLDYVKNGGTYCSGRQRAYIFAACSCFRAVAGGQAWRAQLFANLLSAK